MSNFCVAIWANGSYALHTEHETAEAATKEFYTYCGNVLAEAETKEEYNATIKVLDAQLDNYNGLKCKVLKTKPAPAPEATPAPEETPSNE